jgi:hypothetical protein
MAEDSLAQRFAKSYSGNRRIEKPQAEQAPKPAFGKAITVFRQGNQRHDRKELREWFQSDDIESLNRPIYEAKRMVGDTLTVCHIDYHPTAAMTPRWEAFGKAYGVRFILTLWQEDIEFINRVTGAGIEQSDYTPSTKLDIVVKRFDGKRGLVGAMGVFHQHKAIFVGEETPITRKFQPTKPKSRKEWAESPFKPVR